MVREELKRFWSLLLRYVSCIVYMILHSHNAILSLKYHIKILYARIFVTVRELKMSIVGYRYSLTYPISLKVTQLPCMQVTMYHNIL